MIEVKSVSHQYKYLYHNTASLVKLKMFFAQGHLISVIGLASLHIVSDTRAFHMVLNNAF